MLNIRKLPPNVIAKISAGEVIERPVFAVKELIENALDAKATNIAIYIEEGGLKKIRVQDDGSGMNKKDLLESYKPHTTSKLFQEADLQTIKTMGFRGEALASIAAVSQLTIQSRTGDQPTGTLIELEHGQLKRTVTVGMAVGTQVVIDNLFANLPARKKFLKNVRAEFRLILDLITHYGLVYPKIRFTLNHNQKTIFDLPIAKQSNTRFKQLLGDDITNNLIPVTAEATYLKINGFITHPQLNSQSQQKQFLFINQRKVQDRLIALAVKEAYGSLLDQTSFPIFIIFLEMPFELVDVNVHPRKEQVAFTDSSLIHEVVKKSVQSVLAKYDLTFTNLLSENRGFKRAGLTNSYFGMLLKDEISPELEKIMEITQQTPISQLRQTYLNVVTKKGLVIIDQHAAHERILYEKLLKIFQLQKQKLKAVQLKKTVVLDLSIIDSQFLLENQALFLQLGFEIEQIKAQSFFIRTVPDLFVDRNIQALVLEMIEDIQRDEEFKTIDNLTHKMLTYIACHSAIRAGDKLSQIQARKLITELELCPNNYTCPHGRPTRIEISLRKLNQAFKRE